MENIKLKARELRKNMTPQEIKLWQIIRNKQFYGYRFLRQYPIGNYIVDFVCISKKIVIEIDGGKHNQQKNIVYDKNRTKYIESCGFSVIRFWNNEIDDNLDGVYLKLMDLFGVK